MEIQQKAFIINPELISRKLISLRKEIAARTKRRERKGSGRCSSVALLAVLSQLGGIFISERSKKNITKAFLSLWVMHYPLTAVSYNKVERRHTANVAPCNNTFSRVAELGTADLIDPFKWKTNAPPKLCLHFTNTSCVLFTRYNNFIQRLLGVGGTEDIPAGLPC